MSVDKKCDVFLAEMGVDPHLVEMESLCLKFSAEMNRALQGESSSLPMLATHLRSDVALVPNQQVMVIDAGGTNLRTSLVSFDQHKKATIKGFQRRSMPGIQQEVTSQEFFSAFADEIERLFEQSDLIGFCFSYEAEISPDYDAKILRFSKEIQADSVVGFPLGKSLLKEMSHRGHKIAAKRVVVLNDTVATLLASRLAVKEEQFSSLIGFILGTGTNTAYVQSDGEIINVEAGGFDLILGKLDEQFFATTQEPLVHRFEKLVSGAYLGPYAHLCLTQAVEHGLFADDFGRQLEQVKSFSTAQISDFLEPTRRSTTQLHAWLANQQEERVLSRILEAIIERAGKLAAVNLAAVILQADAGFTKEQPIYINADGTTFYKTTRLKGYIEAYLKMFLQGEYQRYYRFLHVPDSPTLGTAVAALHAISSLNE